MGIEVHPGRMIDCVEALHYIQIGHRDDFYHATRSLFVHSHDQIALFDRAFHQFWRLHGPGIVTDLSALFPTANIKPETLFIPPMLAGGDESPAGDNADQPEEELLDIVEITRTFSAQEQLRQKDFGQMTAEELEEVKLLMAQMVWNLGKRGTRRYRPGKSLRVDVRRSLRHSLRYGGEFLTWSYREPVWKPRPLVVLADISGSMEQYSRLLIYFTYSLAAALSQKVETFVFGTRLTRITRQLQHKDLAVAIQEVAHSVPDWSGGTRIGQSLKSFNFEWGRRVLSRGAVVLIISDGWDRGEPELLGSEAARLKRNCRRLIWLNPLLGSRRYEPLTRGMVAALPYCDDFLPVHSLNSLSALAEHLALLDYPRPARNTTTRQAENVSSAAFIGAR